jgi:flagellar hook-associated protein 1 FlgK
MAPGANADVLAADGTVITSDLGSGSIAGALQVRDQMVPAYLQQLDQLAYTVVQQVNSLHASGFDLSGQPGGNFFTPIANVAGAASAIAVDPAIVADPSKIAAASTTAAGDNGNAKAIANLAGANVLNGATLAEGWGSLMARVGRDTQTAQASSDGYAAVIQQLQAVNDATSGVSINDEAAMLLKFQRASQANAQFFSTVNDAITTLFNMIG